MSADTPHGTHDEHGHGHGGSRFIQHHYDDAQHQFDSGKFGIWLFLAQEVLFFSALFVAYILYRYHHPEIYSYAHKYLDVKYGAINTAVLIFSSLTAAWAVRAAQLAQRMWLIACLVITLLCAVTFLCIKYIEYSHKYHEHILFGRHFDPCVSSGEVPLLTKNNECPGSKGSVVWDYTKSDVRVGPLTDKQTTQSGVPREGCFSALQLDLKPNESGIQASCRVREVTVATPLVNGEPQKDKDGAPIEKEISSKEITKTCPDPIAAIEHHGEGGEAEHAEHADHSAGKPCWRIAYQPAVCRPAFYANTWCTRTKQAPDLPPDPKAPKCVAFQTIGPFAKRGDCDDALTAREAALKKLSGDEAKALNLPERETSFTYKLGECTPTPSYGFLVEYGDHEERGEKHTGNGIEDLRIRAECDAPAPPVTPADPFAEKQAKAEVGKKGEPYRVLSAHQEHELEAAGPPPEHTGMFFTIYFAMTGLHGFHVLAGVVVFIWLLIRAIKGHFTPDYFGPVDFAALYWHIVDLIWIFLFPLLYLIH